MKKAFTVLFLIISFQALSQTKIGYIEFDFHHSLKIGMNVALNVAIEYEGKRPVLTILKDSYLGEERLKKNQSVYLFKKEYKRIVEEIQKIDFSAMLNELDINGLDGTSTKLFISGVGWTDNQTEFSFWSPDFYTEKRGLTHYYEACRLIIKAAGLNPEDYF